MVSKEFSMDLDIIWSRCLNPEKENENKMYTFEMEENGESRWTERKTNEQMAEMASKERKFLAEIWKRQSR
jgi:hypothetical protein